MPINVILHGDLEKKQQQKIHKESNPLRINPTSNEINTVYDVLDKLNIE